MVIAILVLIIIIGVVIYVFFFRKTDGITKDKEQVTYVYWNNNFVNSTFLKKSVPKGAGLNGTYTTREALATAYSDWKDNPIYVKTTKVDETVTSHVICLWYNNREFCIGPNYWIETGNGGNNHQSEENGIATKNKLQAEMEATLGTQAKSCSSSLDVAKCYFGDFYCSANSYGNMNCHSFITSDGCYVGDSGSAYCYNW